MNTSNTQTETVDPAGQGSNTKPLGTPDQSQAQTLGSDTLPPPKQDLGEAEREELRSSVEVLADLDKDDAGNHKPHFERDVFEDANFKNGDDLLDRYRTELVDLLKSDAEQRTKAYDGESHYHTKTAAQFADSNISTQQSDTPQRSLRLYTCSKSGGPVGARWVPRRLSYSVLQCRW